MCDDSCMNTTSTEAKVIPFSRRERESQARMTGGKGDYFRTVATEDEFRRRADVAMARLAK